MNCRDSCCNKKGVAALHVAESLKSEGSLIAKRNTIFTTRFIVVVKSALEMWPTWTLWVSVPVRIVAYVDFPVVGVKILVVLNRYILIKA